MVKTTSGFHNFFIPYEFLSKVISHRSSQGYGEKEEEPHQRKG